MYPLVVIEFIGGWFVILFIWVIIVRLANTILGVPTTPIVYVSSLELLFKVLPNPRPKFIADPISIPLLTKFVLGATTISTLVVGMITWSSQLTSISTCCFWILTTFASNILSEVELTQVWQCPIVWLPIGILYDVECECKYTFGTLLLNWMDGQIYWLHGPNWPLNSMPLKLL
jgi:hypothetical protein